MQPTAGQSEGREAPPGGHRQLRQVDPRAETGGSAVEEGREGSSSQGADDE